MTSVIDNIFVQGGLAFVLLFLISFIYVNLPSAKYRYPPGPFKLPIIGHIHLLPPDFPGPTFSKLADKYGEMMTIQLGGQRWVYLNSARVTRDILERKSAVTSSRPRWAFMQETLSGGKRMVLMPYTNTWRTIRKIMHQLLTAKQADMYRPFQDAESKQLLWDYLHSPDQFYQHNGRYANSVIMSVVFGKRTRSDDPNVVQLFRTIDDFLGSSTPPGWMVDLFPQLTLLPKWMQWWRPFGEDGYNRTIGVYRKFFAEYEKSVEDGTSQDCFASRFETLVGQYDFDPDQQKFVYGTMVEAGSDTTRNQNNVLVAAAATDPRWLRRVQAELDSVCGSNAGRLPTWSDRDKLPLVQAVIKESMRWRPNLVPGGLPHVSTEDIEYEGYLFEKGTCFSWNNWHLSLSEKEHEDPLTFKPERYVNEHLWDTLEGQWNFGVGRRVCVGWNIAHRNMFIVFARLLYCFDFFEDPTEPIDTFKIPVQTGPKGPFKVIIKPRSPAHAELIRRECKEVADELASLGQADLKSH